jgi:hypothetical protein
MRRQAAAEKSRARMNFIVKMLGFGVSFFVSINGAGFVPSRPRLTFETVFHELHSRAFSRLYREQRLVTAASHGG